MRLHPVAKMQAMRTYGVVGFSPKTYRCRQIQHIKKTKQNNSRALDKLKRSYYVSIRERERNLSNLNSIERTFRFLYLKTRCGSGSWKLEAENWNDSTALAKWNMKSQKTKKMNSLGKSYVSIRERERNLSNLNSIERNFRFLYLKVNRLEGTSRCSVLRG